MRTKPPTRPSGSRAAGSAGREALRRPRSLRSRLARPHHRWRPWRSACPWRRNPTWTTTATANAISVGGYIAGLLTTPNTQDVFKVVIPTAGVYTFETSGLIGSCGVGIEMDTFLTVENSAGVGIGSNNDEGSQSITGPFLLQGLDDAGAWDVLRVRHRDGDERVGVARAVPVASAGGAVDARSASPIYRAPRRSRDAARECQTAPRPIRRPLERKAPRLARTRVESEALGR